MKYFERWRHTRGYGVHSPLAFRIVKDCIYPDSKYAFYSDSYLDFEYHEDRRNLKIAKMTIRLVNLLRPKRIWMPDCDKRIFTALNISFPSITVATRKECPKNVDFIICNSSDYCPEMWHKMDSMPECGLMVFGKGPEKIEDATLIISNKGFTIALKRVGMDFVRYNV